MKRHFWASLEEWRKSPSRKPLLLKGARQVGKTHILKEFGTKGFPAVHYVNFEEDDSLAGIFDGDLKPGRILSEIQFALRTRLDPERDLLILDEIQRCPRALTSLKYFQEEMPSLAVCAAGSLLGVRFGAEPFPVGKVRIMTMHPLSFTEFLAGTGDGESAEFLGRHDMTRPLPEIVHARLWDRFKSYLVVGGLPEVVVAYAALRDDPPAAMAAARERQIDLVQSYNADMAKYSGKTNAMHLDRLWRNVPAQLARTQDGSAPKFKFKGVIPEVRGYARLAGAIDWLEAAGLIIRVPIVNSGSLPFSAHSSENFFKLYLFDVGILGALSGLDPKSVLDYDFGTYKGYFAENFAAQEFTAAGMGPLHCWREGTAEVEFVRECGGKAVPIEIKSGWVTQAKSLSVFAKKYAPPFVTVMSGRNLRVSSGRVAMPLFLASRFPIVPG